MSDSPDLGDEEQLLQALDEMLDDSEPLPSHMSEYAHAVFTMRDIDSELAQLTFDSMSERDPVAVRGDGSPRVVVFTAGELSVELQASSDEEMLGQIVPPQRYVVLVQTIVDCKTIETDAAGSFRTSRPSGDFAMRIESPGGTVVTEPITL